MADVYQFRIELTNCSRRIYRGIEISSLSSVAKLGYTVIASFEGAASHLFCINSNNNRYEIDCGVYGMDIVLVNPVKTKLEDLNLVVSDTLTMEYDYGAGWEFTIELLSIDEMEKGTGQHYPYVINGQGKGILEDMFPPQLDEIMEETERTGIIPLVYSVKHEKEIKWDYRDFNIESTNIFLKYDIEWIQRAYEQPQIQRGDKTLN